MISVIIPYYQNDPNVLSRAITSVLLQKVEGCLEILVIDDQSPAPPCDDISAGLPCGWSLKIISKKNGGPGSARNVGLDNVSPDSKYVAFLDSDDVWADRHLSNAIVALGEDLDFYFSNYLEPGADIDQFQRARKIWPEHHRKLDRANGCYEYLGSMDEQIIIKNVIETSTVVFRRAVLGGVRFREDYRNAFEDHLFWLDAAKISRGFAFSTSVECRYGKGVNIFRSAGLGGERQFRRLKDQINYWRFIRREFGRSKNLKSRIRKCISETRVEFVAEILHRLRRRMTFQIDQVVAFFRVDPMLFILFIPILIKIVIMRKRRL